MAIFKGRAKAKNMATVLDGILKGIGYQEISSNVASDGRVYKSLGESGISEFYIQLLPANSQYIRTGIYEKYVPDATMVNPGVFTNGRTNTSLVWAGNINLPELDVDYIVNINKDRMIIYVEGEITDSRSTGSLCYVGVPKRYDSKDNNSNFAGIASLGAVDNVGQAWYALKNRALTLQFGYTFAYYNQPKSFIWGSQLFLSPMVLGSTDEGPRGELDDLFFIKTPDSTYEARHKDTFVRDGKTYVLLGKYYNTNGSLPNAWYAMRI